MAITLNYSTLSKQAKIGYNALYNVVFSHVATMNDVNRTTEFIVPLCLNSDNKVSLSSRHFIYFDTILNELNVAGYYAIVKNNGRAVDDVKTDYSTVKVVLSRDDIVVPADVKQFDFSDVDVTKLQQRNGKAEKQKTAENKAKKDAEKTAVDALKQENETLKQQVVSKPVADKGKKEQQINKKAIDDFNDTALLDIASCVEKLIIKHCNVPANFDFARFENDLFTVACAHWDIKALK